MSPLWSDMALARAAWAKADELESALGGKAKPKASERPASVRRPVRRVHHSWLSSSFAL
jgi:hypothetical protein